VNAAGPEPGHRPVTIDELERWVAAGANWRAVELTEARAVVDLCQCTGELVERRETADAATIAYLRTHPAERGR
jgi:hypothetical protein